MRALIPLVLGSLLALNVAQAAPPAFPEKPIRLVLGSAPGSGPDIIARALADRLYGAWGQRIVVDARPGVAGILSADLVLRTVPDGYTWMILTSQLLVATSVYPNVKFNLGKDFVSVSLIGTVPFVLVVNPEIPAKSLRELVDYAEALSATMGKEVHLTYGVVPAVLGAVQAGRVRALGVTGPKRNALLPDVPSISEAVPGYNTLGWYSVVAPVGTPEAVLAKASAEIAKSVKDPQFGEQLRGLGLDLVGSTRAELDAFRREQTTQIGDIVKAAGVTVK